MASPFKRGGSLGARRGTSPTSAFVISTASRPATALATSGSRRSPRPGAGRTIALPRAGLRRRRGARLRNARLHQLGRPRGGDCRRLPNCALGTTGSYWRTSRSPPEGKLATTLGAGLATLASASRSSRPHRRLPREAAETCSLRPSSSGRWRELQAFISFAVGSPTLRAAARTGC